MNVTSKQNQEQWKALCEYIKSKILKYGDKKIFPKILALRLKGLACAQEYVQGKQKQLYNYEFIQNVFEILESKIISVIDSTNIKDEKHLCNLIMKIAQDNFNDIVDLYDRKKKTEEYLVTLSDDVLFEGDTTIEYKPKRHKTGDKW